LKLATTTGLIDVVLLIYTAIIACMLLGMGGDYFVMIGNGISMNEKLKYGHRMITNAEKQADAEKTTRVKRQTIISKKIPQRLQQLGYTCSPLFDFCAVRLGYTSGEHMFVDHIEKKGLDPLDDVSLRSTADIWAGMGRLNPPR